MLTVFVNSGDTVTAFDIAYDFKSVMHYPLDRYSIQGFQKRFDCFN